MPLTLSRLPNGAPEIFESLQGEGVSMGLPSVFVRLSGCSLACSWCDTAYTWNWRAYDPKVQAMQLDISDVARRVTPFGTPNVVVTGGEPLLQQQQLIQLARELKQAGKRIEVETSGTISALDELAAHIDQWNVSPKLSNSQNAHHKREIPQAFCEFARRTNAYFKFVIVEPEDLTEVDELVRRYAVSTERVLLMPEGRTPAALQARSRWLAEACQHRGYRFTTRLHVLLWGDERGR